MHIMVNSNKPRTMILILTLDGECCSKPLWISYNTSDNLNLRSGRNTLKIQTNKQMSIKYTITEKRVVIGREAHLRHSIKDIRGHQITHASDSAFILTENISLPNVGTEWENLRRSIEIRKVTPEANTIEVIRSKR